VSIKGWQGNSVYSKLSAEADLLLIHADLHIYNVIQSDAWLGVIDFDDCGIGLPIQDLVITNYYLREVRQREEYVKAGYSSLLELPKVSSEDYETLLMGRLLPLIGTVLAMTAAEDIAAIPGFLKRAELRLNHFFDRGQFSLL
jgi:Ser/Thr protein kinase RdoA (MazF antagonist)